MKQVWCKRDIGNPSASAHSYLARGAKFKFGEKAYINRNAYLQHKMDKQVPGGYVGYVLSTRGGKETYYGLIAAEVQLVKIRHQRLINGEPV